MNNPIDTKCLSVNIRGLNKLLKRRTVFRWLHLQKLSYKKPIAQKNAKTFGKRNGAARCFLATAQIVVRVP